MIVGRNPRNPVIGDTVLLRADNRRASAQSSTPTRIRYKITGATEEANCLGIPAASWPSLDSISDGDGHDVPEGQVTMTATVWDALEVRKVNFHIGDEVRVGTRVGTITDVGTIPHPGQDKRG